MKTKNWLFLFALPTFLLADDCTNDEEVLSYLRVQQPQNFEKISIKSDYKIRNWNYIYGRNTLETDGIFEMTWTNNSLDFSHLNPCHKSIRIERGLKQWWMPHVYFAHSLEIGDDVDIYNFVVHKNGNCTLSKRIKQVIPCKVNSDNHPFSNTTCTLAWKYSNVAGYQNVSLEKSSVTDTVDLVQTGSLILKEVNFVSAENEPSLIYSFSQDPRDILINFFIPSILFLIPPWLTLLLGPMAITRCCILMTSLILLSIHYHASVTLLLGDGGATAISIWKLFTYCYVIFIVIELIIITLLASIGRSKTCCFAKRRSGKYEMEPLYEEMNDLRQRKTRKTRNCCRKAALFFDIASFLFFGVILILFCYGYYAGRNSAVRMINDFEMESLHIL